MENKKITPVEMAIIEKSLDMYKADLKTWWHKNAKNPIHGHLFSEIFLANHNKEIEDLRKKLSTV